MKSSVLSFFALVVFVQLAVPLNLAWQAEATLRSGVPVKFRLQLRDPYDPMRGKYVRLRYDWDTLSLPKEEASAAPSQLRLCAHVEVDEDGFGTVTAISLEPPHEGLWFRVRASRRGESYWLEPEFDRYFVNEHAAKVAEDLYFDALRDQRSSGDETPVSAYAVVRLRKGIAQLEEVMLDGRPLADRARDAL